MREIPLVGKYAQGQVALCDDSDFELLSQWKWVYLVPTHGGKTGYAYRSGSEGVSRILMHKLLLPGPHELDHKNGNGLDNRRENLRPATRSQNISNRGYDQDSTTGLKGVSCHKATGKYQARISDTNGCSIYLGLFDTAEEAARVYDRKARELFGEFAWLNFP